MVAKLVVARQPQSVLERRVASWPRSRSTRSRTRFRLLGAEPWSVPQFMNQSGRGSSDPRPQGFVHTLVTVLVSGHRPSQQVLRLGVSHVMLHKPWIALAIGVDQARTMPNPVRSGLRFSPSRA